MRRCLLFCSLLLVSLMPVQLQAQENPAPLPPNYERIDKETHRWFGEYRYGRLVRMFWECDTTMTVDHFRCLYYGAAMRGDKAYTLAECHARYTLKRNLLGQWNPTTQDAWWQLQMMLAAVWSSGNGTEEHPFHVASRPDALYMRDDIGDSIIHCMLMGEPMPKL